MSSPRRPGCLSRARSTTAITSSRSVRQLAPRLIGLCAALGHDVPDDWQADRRDQRRMGQQQSIEQSFSPIEGFLLNGDIIWQPTQATKVEFIARSEIDETTLVEFVRRRRPLLRIVVAARLLALSRARDLCLIRNRRLCRRSAGRPAAEGGPDREYYFNPYFSIYARYEHTDFFSTDQGSDFVENEVRLGVRIRH